MPAALRPHEREERAAALAPLVTWMEARGIFCSRVIRRAFARRKGRTITRSHANQIKTGWAPAPDWLIEECCAVLCVPVGLIYPEVAVASGASNGRVSSDGSGGSGAPVGHGSRGSHGSHEWSVA